tara:strand:- start:1209 stop:1370 length:162 start_codon:yes stop_codon:yes gene_type:complete
MYQVTSYKQLYVNSNLHNKELRRLLKKKERENRQLIEHTRRLRKERQEYCYLC